MSLSSSPVSSFSSSSCSSCSSFEVQEVLRIMKDVETSFNPQLSFVELEQLETLALYQQQVDKNNSNQHQVSLRDIQDQQQRVTSLHSKLEELKTEPLRLVQQTKDEITTEKMLVKVSLIEFENQLQVFLGGLEFVEEKNLELEKRENKLQKSSTVSLPRLLDSLMLYMHITNLKWAPSALGDRVKGFVGGEKVVPFDFNLKDNSSWWITDYLWEIMG